MLPCDYSLFLRSPFLKLASGHKLKIIVQTYLKHIFFFHSTAGKFISCLLMCTRTELFSILQQSKDAGIKTLVMLDEQGGNELSSYIIVRDKLHSS